MYLFVYGTLRQNTGTAMHGILAHNSEFFGMGLLQGKLYLVGDYPGVVLSDNPADRVLGELYAISQAHVLGLMDEYEECTDEHPQPHEYIRRICPVKTETGLRVDAWVYLFNHATDNLRSIVSGDFINR